MKSPLQLEKCRVSRFEIVVNDSFTASEGVEKKVAIKTDMNVWKADGRNAFRVKMMLSLSPEVGHEATTPIRKLVAEADAIFTLPEDFTPEKVCFYVPTNCLAIVYGIMRGHIMAISGSIGVPSLLLPSVDIGRMFRECEERRRRRNLRKKKRESKSATPSGLATE